VPPSSSTSSFPSALTFCSSSEFLLLLFCFVLFCLFYQAFFFLLLRTDGTEIRPVMIHRAILGSVERMIAILTENYAGKWPFWLSPRQISIVPVAPSYYDYARQVAVEFTEAGFFVDVDDSGDTMNKKIRNGQIENYNFIFGELTLLLLLYLFLSLFFFKIFGRPR